MIVAIEVTFKVTIEVALKVTFEITLDVRICGEESDFVYFSYFWVLVF